MDDQLGGDASTASAAAAASTAGNNNPEPDTDTCRICRGEATPQEPLFYPCKCSGSIKYVHQDCLMEWLSHSQKKHCELCKTSFRFTKLYSPTMPKKLPVFVFLRHLVKYFVRNVLVWCRVALVASVWLGWLPYLTRWEWSFFFWISEEGLVSPQKALAAAASNAALRGGSGDGSGNGNGYCSVGGATAASAAATAVCPASPLFALTTTAAEAAVGSYLRDNPAAAQYFDALVSGLYGTNGTAADAAAPVGPNDSFIAVVFRLLLSSFLMPDVASLVSANGTFAAAGADPAAAAAAVSGSSTLLGDVGFLRTLTRFPAVNRTIIYAMEGQVITILVIICFILVILVRDYVVQQQPEINMRAAFAAAENAGIAVDVGAAAPPPPPPEMNPRRPHRHHHHNHHHHHHNRHNDHDHRHHQPQEQEGGDDAREHDHHAADDHFGQHDSEWETESGSEAGDGPASRNVVVLDARNQIPLDRANDQRNEDWSAASSPSATRASSPTLAEAISERAAGTSGQSNRDDNNNGRPSSAAVAAPTGASETGFAPAAELEVDTSAASDASGGSQTGRDAPTVQEYLRIYRQAGGDSEKILRIAREENLDGRLQYWLRLTQQVVDKRQSDKDEGTSAAEGEGSESQSESRPSSGVRADAAAATTETTAASSTSGQVTDVGQHWYDELAGSSNFLAANHKGKEKAEANDVDRAEQEAQPQASNPSPNPRQGQNDDGAAKVSDFDVAVRRRANTDGPQPTSKSPLADNNWEFSNFLFPPSGELAKGNNTASDGHVNAAASSSRAACDQAVPGVEHEHEQDGVARTGRQPFADIPEEEVADDTMTPAIPAPGALAGSSTAPAATATGAMENGEPREIRIDGDVAAVPPHTAVAVAAAAAADAPDGAPRPAGVLGTITNFMWRGLDNINPDELPPLAPDGFFDEDGGPFDDVDDDDDDDDSDEEDNDDANADGNGAADNFGRNQDVMEAAAAAGLDAEAIDDAEDLEGVMELLGMRGPIAALFQNAIFCAFLVTITLLMGIFLPYNIGRFSVWLIANPMRPVMMLFSLSKLLQDLAAVVLGGCAFGLLYAFRTVLALSTWVTTGGGSPPAAGAPFASTLAAAWRDAGRVAWACLRALPTVLANPGSWVITLDALDPVQVNPAFAYWDSTDRCLAILLGYSSLCLVAGLYLYRGTPFSSSQTGQEWEASIIDGLNQASGVLKVILIIGIEMLVFPLYCGLLLDVALLPLFEHTTLTSRLYFSLNYPLTSIFVHWFVGTGYMFHFALFVSMCRKIMRKGVLYFIRDPDDPEFHPVRDVLERSVTTQLRKILFSAFVYGALVVVCLGGVVWGLALAAPGVLPIHYSSNEPVLEFPIDLLFYNFLMPLAIRFFKPSDGLHAMYTWWFRTSARMLRITWFLFGERKIDEEGVLTLRPQSPHRQRAWLRRQFLEYRTERGGSSSSSSSSTGEVVPMTLNSLAFMGNEQHGAAGAAAHPKPRTEMTQRELAKLSAKKRSLVQSRQLVPDGRFVRAPASDQVKIPKGRPVFLDVTESGLRRDLLRAAGETHPYTDADDLYASNQYELVYIPPHFRLRVFFFIACIWLFAAVTGVACTILPLLFGRRLFQLCLPAHIQTNDIYAFSIGIYVLGSAATARAVRRTARLVYAYFFLIVVFPLLATVLVELYVLIPLHTYMYPATATAAVDTTAAAGDSAAFVQGDGGGGTPRHTVRLIQSWTLGLLYLKLAACTVSVADARGVLACDVLTAVGLAGSSSLDANLVYRLSFPCVALAVVAAWSLWGMVDVMGTWKMRIRDEAYLIGERLHNFGATSAPQARRAWRAGGGRL
ncbi:Zinc finger, RING-CH-type [Niveomyces insectorum RCEF 264]|uniref:RING-type E3 ubiquitin transferase n=1 Tax=Niveomyces insectorum RCEF 264 TaxID=1081102 RepID=A0A167RWG8_9HYPO|nr:Zinc finger, RING-CH-type [Niveomyces insectorum RCEF 264]